MRRILTKRWSPQKKMRDPNKKNCVPCLSLAVVLKKNLKSRINETLTAKHRKQIC